jgi:hypothetical protein
LFVVDRRPDRPIKFEGPSQDGGEAAGSPPGYRRPCHSAPRWLSFERSRPGRWPFSVVHLNLCNEIRMSTDGFMPRSAKYWSRRAWRRRDLMDHTAIIIGAASDVGTIGPATGKAMIVAVIFRKQAHYSESPLGIPPRPVLRDTLTNHTVCPMRYLWPSMILRSFF